LSTGRTLVTDILPFRPFFREATRRNDSGKKILVNVILRQMPHAMSRVREERTLRFLFHYISDAQFSSLVKRIPVKFDELLSAGSPHMAAVPDIIRRITAPDSLQPDPSNLTV
jgi:hypothetical protein